MSIETTRDLDTGDNQDRKLDEGLPKRLIAAFGTSTDLSYHGSNRLAFRLKTSETTTDLFSGDASVERLDVVSAAYEIPDVPTTYHSTCVDVPESLGTVHLVGMAPKIQESTRDFVHHFVLYGYSSLNCGETVAIDECPGPFNMWYCDNSTFTYGQDCSGGCNMPETCSESLDGSAYSSCATTPSSNNHAYSCENNEIVMTDCATGVKTPKSDMAETYLCGCDAEAGNSGGERVLYLWAPGGEPLKLPEEAGFRVGPGSVVSMRLEIHYNNPKLISNEIDSSGISLYYTSALRPHDAGMALLGDFQGDLFGSEVALESGMARHRFSCTPGCTSQYFGQEEVNIFGVQLHMHGTGSRKVLRHYDTQGSLKYSKVAAEFYDFNFQDLADIGTDVLTLKGGDSFVVDCYYDERNSNDFTGTFGLGSQDEMCDTFIWFWPAKDDGQFKCSVDDCEAYCGIEPLNDISQFERTFGLPCGSETNITRDYSTYQGCNTGIPTTDAPLPENNNNMNNNKKKNKDDGGLTLGLIIIAAIFGLGILIASACLINNLYILYAADDDAEPTVKKITTTKNTELTKM